MDGYAVRVATAKDTEVLVRHRIGMFSDMGVTLDRASVAEAFRGWVARQLAIGSYRAWVVETVDGEAAAGGGINIIPWPPGPQYLGGRVAFVYNVYTEPPHRRRGLARLVMDAIHGWCGAEGIGVIALHASPDGQPLYEAMGYRPWPAPMMFLALGGDSR